jgi:hypothetical protein
MGETDKGTIRFRGVMILLNNKFNPWRFSRPFVKKSAHDTSKNK